MEKDGVLIWLDGPAKYPELQAEKIFETVPQDHLSHLRFQSFF